MFNLYGTERLTEWREFRNKLETSNNPFQEVASFWSRAPFVSPYLNPNNPSDWPDPWHLILDDRYDELAIALGMLYTIKLTQRFMNTKCEIHTSLLPEEKTPRYLLIVEDKVLNLEYNGVVDLKDFKNIKTNMIWSKV